MNGLKIKELREKHGLTRSKLAKAVGVSHVMIQYIEENKRDPSLETLRRIAETLECDAKDLI